MLVSFALQCGLFACSRLTHLHTLEQQSLWPDYWSLLLTGSAAFIALIVLLPVFRDMGEGQMAWRYSVALLLAIFPLTILISLLGFLFSK